MVSKHVCESGSGAMAYFAKHLDSGDYYVDDQSHEKGEWIGKIAARVGLEGEGVTAEKFQAFVECDLEALGAESSRQRTSKRKYVEFTYSAPKCVSLVAALDDRVKAQIYAAVKEEFRWFEESARARDRRGDLCNQEKTRPTGEIMAALFQHETSRTNDPNFHVHGLIGNMTFDKERGEYLALDYGEMMELRKTLDYRIHNNLAERMERLGYRVEAATNGFGLREVPPTVLDAFSQRGNQVDLMKDLLRKGYSEQQLTRFVKSLSATERKDLLTTPDLFKVRLGSPDGKGAFLKDHEADQIAVMLTRPEKEIRTSQALREDVKNRLKESGVTIPIPKSRSYKRLIADQTREEMLKQGIDSIFERSSVVRLDELVGEIVRLNPGKLTNKELTKALRDNKQFVIRKVDGVEKVTTQLILAEERTLLTAVAKHHGTVESCQKASEYKTPKELKLTPERVKEMVSDAAKKGEVLTADQAAKWLSQFSGIHEYVCTSQDRFVNVRGGAGVGKTFCMELLVEASLNAGRPVVLAAPYGEQSRITMRSEAPRLAEKGTESSAKIAAAFSAANTVDYLLVKARTDDGYLEGLRGADIYVDEAGLLDTPKALQLVRLAEKVNARVIFQGDTEQMAAVGRGQPIKLLQEEIGLGMHVERASISRRQKQAEDKELASDLSSGSDEKFSAAVKKMMDRGMISESSPEVAIEKVAQEIVEGRAKKKDVVAVSSVHRLSEKLADRVHALHLDKQGNLGQGMIDVHVKKDLKPSELKSSQFYRVGDVVEIKKLEQLIRKTVLEVKESGLVLDPPTGDQKKPTAVIPFNRIKGVYDRKQIERGSGETLVLQEKIKIGRKVFEKGSRQKIVRVDENKTIHFESGLKLPAVDGRVRQGDCLTDYKSQGIKGAAVRGIEDNGSASAMANREAFHVKGTRHVEDLVIYVESKEVYSEAVMRSNRKVSAIELEQPDKDLRAKQRQPASRETVLKKAEQWGRDWGEKVISGLRSSGKAILKQVQNLPTVRARLDDLQRRREELARHQRQQQQQKTKSKIKQRTGELEI